jgi:hypothetical protein
MSSGGGRDKFGVQDRGLRDERGVMREEMVEMV